MLILIAGPYTSGARTDAARAANLRAMNEAALAVFQRGHTPLIGVNAVQPIIDVAGPDSFESLMMPICLELAARCDAVLRIGGPSRGADDEVDAVARAGGRVFRSLKEIPAGSPRA